jgi:hypothetical protein
MSQWSEVWKQFSSDSTVQVTWSDILFLEHAKMSAMIRIVARLKAKKHISV